MKAVSERMEVLDAYRNAAQQLVDLFAQGPDLIDLDALERLLDERNQLILRYNELGSSPLNADERAVAAEIEQLDAIASAAMLDKQQQTRQRLSNFQTQRRSHAAYSGEYAYDAAFIDKRK